MEWTGIQLIKGEMFEENRSMEGRDVNEEGNSILPFVILLIHHSSKLPAGSGHKLAVSSMWHWDGNVIPPVDVT